MMEYEDFSRPSLFDPSMVSKYTGFATLCYILYFVTKKGALHVVGT